MPDSGWLVDTEGLTVQGASGGGKTTFTRALHDRYPGPSVYFDLDEEPDLGHSVGTVGELREVLASGADRVVVRGGTFDVTDPELFPDVVRFMMAVGDELRRGGSSKMQFIMGEAQDLQDEWVQVAMKRFRKRRIKPVVETQDPVSLSPRVRTQAAYQAWVSPPTNKQAESLRSTNWPVDELEQLGEHDTVIYGQGWEPLDRVRVDERYVAE